jgi:hypothetical protein
MTLRSLLMVPVMVLGLGAGGALAAPAVGVKDIATGDASLLHKVHGCHRSCELGGAGWHRHVGPYCRRVACAPRAWYPHRCFVDRYGVRRCRW